MTADQLYSRLQENDLGLAGYLLLRNIEVSGEFMGDLSAMMDMTPANCGQHIQRLERKGWVEKVRDGQKVMVNITGDGLKLLGRFDES